jgi:hypothetical protein
MRPPNRFCGLYQSVEAASAVYMRPRKPYISNNYLDFLGEFEAIFETALAHESGPYGGLFDETKPRVENLVTLSL